MESPIIAKLPRGHRMDRQFGVVFDTAPESSDDLTRIEGIRTREAVLLNQMGIYFWGQIALWRPSELAAIAEELQLPVNQIMEENWPEHARTLCSTSSTDTESTLPASVLRTVSLLACALLIGFLTVYMLGQDRHAPLTGILSADITTIRVPAAARLTGIQIKPGDEVFSGQPLLTLEKIEHLTFIENQENLVRDIERQLKRVEAQAAIELEWRTREIDHEISNVRQKVATIELDGTTASRFREEKPLRAENSPPVIGVSSQKEVPHPTPTSSPRSRGIIFFSGASGQSSPVPEPAFVKPSPAPIRIAQAPRNNVVSDSVNIPNVEAQLQDLRSEQQRLESVKASLPTIVNEAVGATSLKAQYADASRQLELLKSVSREVQVTSPVYGTVGQVHYQEGDDMEAGEIMVRILHTDRRYITAYLPTRRINEVRSGQEVELRFPGNQTFRGQVADVPLVADLTDSGDNLAPIRIEQAGRLWPNVPVGTQIDVISKR